MDEKELKLQAKTVQEIARNVNNNNDETKIPEKFIYKNGYPQHKVENVPLMDDVVIDLSLLFDDDDKLQLQKLRSAIGNWGCFQVINHGLSSTFLDKVCKVTKQFFALPLEEKQKYSRSVNDWDGYGNDTINFEGQTLDWNDRIYLKVYPLDLRKLKYWPEKPLELREVLHEYTMKLRAMFDSILKAIARSLNLDENCFLVENGDLLTMGVRFNFYPPCPSPENVIGVKPHSDSSTVTMLLQDKEVEGLQVLKDDQWFRVPVIPYGLFINVGDMLEIMSNGSLKSAVHRVVTNPKRERISLAMFFLPGLEKEIGPIDEFITDDQPKAYRRVKVIDFENLIFKYYQLGQRTLDAVKL